MRYFACAMQLLTLSGTALPLLGVSAPRCAFAITRYYLLCHALCVSGTRYDLPLPHKAITAPPAFAAQSNHCSAFFAVVVLHATGPRYANEVLCAAGPCYASEVFRSAGPCYATEVLHATGSCYAIDEIYCATPVRLTALLCVSMPMPRGTWLCITKALLLFAPPFQRNVSLHGFIQCRCCVNLSHQCQCDADAVLI